MNQVEKAELIQSLNAFLIPSSLFVACLCGAAGVFLLYNAEPFGYLFLAISFGIIFWAFVAFVQFQNKLRAKGQFPKEYEIDEVPSLKQS